MSKRHERGYVGKRRLMWGVDAYVGDFQDMRELYRVLAMEIVEIHFPYNYREPKFNEIMDAIIQLAGPKNAKQYEKYIRKGFDMGENKMKRTRRNFREDYRPRRRTFNEGYRQGYVGKGRLKRKISDYVVYYDESKHGKYDGDIIELLANGIAQKHYPIKFRKPELIEIVDAVSQIISPTAAKKYRKNIIKGWDAAMESRYDLDANWEWESYYTELDPRNQRRRED